MGFVHSAHSVGTVAHCQGGLKGTKVLMSLGEALRAVDLIKFGLILFSLIKWPLRQCHEPGVVAVI